MRALRVAILIPAFQASRTIAHLVRQIQRQVERESLPIPLWVIDDGSSDGTAEAAQAAGATVLSHRVNRGKGAALLTGFRALGTENFEAAVTVDADGQHLPEEALRLALHPATAETFVLGVRNLKRDGAPPSSQFSNGVSNRFLSWFSGVQLLDTQCGLRRYPLRQILGLRCRSPGYAFEAEVILRAKRAGLTIEQVPVRVLYPPPAQRLSHFHVVKDPARIVFRVLGTWLERGAP